MSADQARALLDEVSDDGIASRAEAEAILQINRKLDDVFPDWDERFCGLLKDYLLTSEAPVGWIDTAQSHWLAEQIAPFLADVKANELDLLLSVLPHAEGDAEPLAKCTLDAFVALAGRSGRMTAERAIQLETLLLQIATPERSWITKWEARALLKLNDHIGYARNDEGWNTLYARAMANHLVAMAHPAPENIIPDLDRKTWLTSDTEAELGGTYLLGIQSEDEGTWFERISPSLTLAACAHAEARALAKEPASVSPDDGNWLVNRLGWSNKTVSLADRTLISFFNTHAPGFTLGITMATRAVHPASDMAFS